MEQKLSNEEIEQHYEIRRTSCFRNTSTDRLLCKTYFSVSVNTISKEPAIRIIKYVLMPQEKVNADFDIVAKQFKSHCLVRHVHFFRLSTFFFIANKASELFEMLSKQLINNEDGTYDIAITKQP